MAEFVLPVVCEVLWWLMFWSIWHVYTRRSSRQYPISYCRRFFVMRVR